MKEKSSSSVSRRVVCTGAGVAGVAGAVAAAASMLPRAPQAVAAPPKALPPQSAGYQASAHVLRYYASAKV